MFGFIIWCFMFQVLRLGRCRCSVCRRVAQVNLMRMMVYLTSFKFLSLSSVVCLVSFKSSQCCALLIFLMTYLTGALPAYHIQIWNVMKYFRTDREPYMKTTDEICMGYWQLPSCIHSHILTPQSLSTKV